MANALTAAALLLPLSGCPFLPHPDTGSARPSIPCSIGAPPLSEADQLSPAMGRWTLTVIKSGAQLCGWTPPSK